MKNKNAIKERMSVYKLIYKLIYHFIIFSSLRGVPSEHREDERRGNLKNLLSYYVYRHASLAMTKLGLYSIPKFNFVVKPLREQGLILCKKTVL
jgi:hypothetical protein